MPVLYTCGEYPADWLIIARLVKDEAAWCCVRCEHKHEPAAGYTLTVHHFDGNKALCERWNLMALCQRCHLSVQARVCPYRPLLFIPSTWAMPYIAGFYEAGRGVPGPLYSLRAWTETYTATLRLPWPAWAPQPREVPYASAI